MFAISLVIMIKIKKSWKIRLFNAIKSIKLYKKTLKKLNNIRWEHRICDFYALHGKTRYGDRMFVNMLYVDILC